MRAGRARSGGFADRANAYLGTILLRRARADVPGVTQARRRVGPAAHEHGTLS